MAKDSKISYIAIPDQISLLVNIDDDLDSAKKELLNNNKITCIILNGNLERSQDALDKLNYIRNYNKNIKIAWFCYRKSIPYKAEFFDYIKLEDALYLHDGDETSQTFVDISKYIETKDKLNNLDPYYFEKFDELNKN
jgi:hypothetical protein